MIMKKIVSVFLLITMLICSSVFALAEETKELSFNTYDSEEGENICVDIVVSGTGNPAMMQFCVAYDSSILEVVSVSYGDAFTGAIAPVINITDGKIYFIWDSLNPLGGNGTVLHIVYRQKNEKGTSVYIDQNESFVVADSSFNDIGFVNGEAKIGNTSSETTSSGGSSQGTSSEGALPGGTPSGSTSSVNTPQENTSQTENPSNKNDKTESSPGTQNSTANSSESLEENASSKDSLLEGNDTAYEDAVSEKEETVDESKIQVLTGNSKETKNYTWVLIPAALILAFAVVMVFVLVKKR